MKPHKHAEIIKKWADGHTIQFRSADGWIDVTDNMPGWNQSTEYRVKPKLVWYALYKDGPGAMYYDSEESCKNGCPGALACLSFDLP